MPIYQENLTKGFDGAWLKASGVSPETFIEVVKNSTTTARWRIGSPKMSRSRRPTRPRFAISFLIAPGRRRRQGALENAQGGSRLASATIFKRLLTSSTPTRRESDARF